MKNVIFYVTFTYSVFAYARAPDEYNDDLNLEIQGKEIKADPQLLFRMQNLLDKIIQASDKHINKHKLARRRHHFRQTRRRNKLPYEDFRRRELIEKQAVIKEELPYEETRPGESIEKRAVDKKETDMRMSDFLQKLFRSLSTLSKHEVNIIINTIENELKRRRGIKEHLRTPSRRSGNKQSLLEKSQLTWYKISSQESVSSAEAVLLKEPQDLNLPEKLFSWMYEFFKHRKDPIPKELQCALDDLKAYLDNKHKEKFRKISYIGKGMKTKARLEMKKKRIEKAMQDHDKLRKIVKKLLKSFLYDQFTNLDVKKQKSLQNQLQSYLEGTSSYGHKSAKALRKGDKLSDESSLKYDMEIEKHFKDKTKVTKRLDVIGSKQRKLTTTEQAVFSNVEENLEKIQAKLGLNTDVEDVSMSSTEFLWTSANDTKVIVTKRPITKRPITKHPKIRTRTNLKAAATKRMETPDILRGGKTIEDEKVIHRNEVIDSTELKKTDKGYDTDIKTDNIFLESDKEAIITTVTEPIIEINSVEDPTTESKGLLESFREILSLEENTTSSSEIYKSREQSLAPVNVEKAAKVNEVNTESAKELRSTNKKLREAIAYKAKHLRSNEEIFNYIDKKFLPPGENANAVYSKGATNTNLFQPRAKFDISPEIIENIHTSTIKPKIVSNTFKITPVMKYDISKEYLSDNNGRSQTETTAYLFKPRAQIDVSERIKESPDNKVNSQTVSNAYLSEVRAQTDAPENTKIIPDNNAPSQTETNAYFSKPRAQIDVSERTKKISDNYIRSQTESNAYFYKPRAQNDVSERIKKSSPSTIKLMNDYTFKVTPITKLDKPKEISSDDNKDSDSDIQLFSAESEALFKVLEEQERKFGLDNLLKNKDLLDAKLLLNLTSVHSKRTTESIAITKPVLNISVYLNSNKPKLR